MSDSNPIRYVGYCRVSTPEQARDGESLAQQARGIEAMARARAGDRPFELELFGDPGLSGGWTVRQLRMLGGPVRPGLSDAIDRAIEMDADALIVDYVNRAARDLDVWRLVRRLCLTPRGVSLWVASGGLDLDDPKDQMTGDLLALLAEGERMHYSERALRTNEERRAAGFTPWGDTPYGWRWQTDEEHAVGGGMFKGILPVPEEGTWVAWIVEQYVGRGRVLEDIARELNDREVPFPRTSKPWHAKRLRDVLGNCLHAGLVEDNDGSLKPGVHFEHRFYDPDVYYAIQDMREERSSRGPRALQQQDSPLLGVITCGRCGMRLQLKRSPDGVPTYICPRPQVGEPRDCTGLSKVAEIVEFHVRDAIAETVGMPRLRELVREEAQQILGERRESLEGRRRHLRKQISEQDQRLEEWGIKFTDGRMSESTFLRLSTKWENDLEEANEQLAEVERLLAVGDEQDRRVERVMQALDSFEETWEQMDAVRIRNLLLTMVEHLSLTPEGDGAATLRLKCYYMPEVEYPIPHLRERLGEGEGPLAELTLTDLAFLALWNEGLTAPEIAEARGISANSGYGQLSVIRRRTGLHDIDRVAEMAKPLIEKYRKVLPIDRKTSDKAFQEALEPTEGQLEVARLCMDLDTYQEVADALGRSLGLVSSQMRKLRQRLGVDSNNEAFLLLAQQGKLVLHDR